MTREVMKQALEALENAVRYHGIMLMTEPPQDAWKYHRVEDNAKQAITAIKEALAQLPLPVQPQRQPLITVEGSLRFQLDSEKQNSADLLNELRELKGIIEKLRAATPPLPVQPVQEPVAWEQRALNAQIDNIKEQP